MQKVYLLLRSNQQTGPFSLEEILEIGLKPFDLVWVNGRSAAWQYPGEIPALQAYVAPTPQPEFPYQPISTSLMEEKKPTPERKVFVSLPRQEKRTAVVANRHESETPPPNVHTLKVPEYFQPVFKDPDPLPASSYHDIVPEQKAVDFSYFNKKQKAHKSTLAVAAVIVLLIGAGYVYLTRPALHGREMAIASQPALRANPAPDNKTETKEDPGEVAKDQAPVTVINARENLSPSGYRQKTSISSKTRVATQKAGSVNFPVKEKNIAQKKMIKDHPASIRTSNKESENILADGRKKMGQVERSIFNKPDQSKKPAEAIVTNDPPPATNRQSQHRSDQVAETPAPAASEDANKEMDLENMVDLSSNAPDNWMMGVTGLKITVRNRSNRVISSAAAEVQYFDANNRLMDKKLVYFNNIPAHGKMTQGAPDNKWADHTEIKLAAVQAKEDRYARNK